MIHTTEYIAGFELSKLAREKGYNIPSYRAYSIWRGNIRKTDTEETALVEYNIETDPYYQGGYYSGELTWYYQTKEYTIAPTLNSLKDWLLKTHNIHIEVLLEEDAPYNRFYYRIMKVGQYFTLSASDFKDADNMIVLEKALYEALENL